MSIIISLLVFSLIIVVHEAGHFIVAKKAGVCVWEFSIGMGPLLVSKQIGETMYSIRALPFGGFCRMQGENEEEDSEFVVEDPSRSFSNKSVAQRIAIFFAGPAMNFVYAFILVFIMLGINGFLIPEIKSVENNSPAIEAGLEAGDRIIEVNGQRVTIYQDFQIALNTRKGSDPVDMTVLRDGMKYDYSIQPEYDEEYGRYMIGFTFDVRAGLFSKPVDGFDNASLLETVKADIGTMTYFVKSVVIGFVQLFTFQVSSEDVSGPIGIINTIEDAYEEGIKSSIVDAFSNLAVLSAILSTNLGIINLFPIPVMDGGRIVFLLIEGIRKKPLNPEIEGRIHFAGFVLLISFMIFVAFNDIVNLIR